MIKFFRKIRQRLLSENKFSKYLIYAIGEIILVVIGILIALQINNWNEDAKAKTQEQSILKGLLDDFKFNRDKFNDYIEFYPEIRSHLGKNLRSFGLSESEISDEIKENTIRTFNKEIEFTQGTLNALFSSNKLELLHNDSLKKKLIAYPAHVERFMERQNDVKDIFLGIHRPIVEEYLSLADLRGWKEIKKGSTAHSDYKGLLNDKRYQNVIMNRIIISNHKLNAAINLKEKTEEIIVLLEESLQKK